LREPLYSRRVTRPKAPHSRALPRLAALTAQIAASLALGSALAAVVAACADDSESSPQAAEGGGEDGSQAVAECPPTAPAPGATCLLPEGTTCDFGLCGTRLARCTSGQWRLGTNAPPSPPCPADPPNPDIACPACWPAEITCTYGSASCSDEDASINTAVASCPNGTWLLDIRPCRDGGEPDVQGDGGPDAD
jgi:hypothetical protein